MCGLLAPTHELEPYVLAHLMTNRFDETAVGHYSTDCSDQLLRTLKKDVERKCGPSELEFRFLKYHEPFVVEIGFPDYVFPVSAFYISRIFFFFDLLVKGCSKNEIDG